MSSNLTCIHYLFNLTSSQKNVRATIERVDYPAGWFSSAKRLIIENSDNSRKIWQLCESLPWHTIFNSILSLECDSLLQAPSALERHRVVLCLLMRVEKGHRGELIRAQGTLEGGRTCEWFGYYLISVSVINDFDTLWYLYVLFGSNITLFDGWYLDNENTITMLTHLHGSTCASPARLRQWMTWGSDRTWMDEEL